MLRKKETWTNVTPIPSFIPRQLAIDILHSHGEIIELSPLVLGFEAVKAPRDAPADEFYATWYEITEKIQFIPGIGRLGSGNIKFKGCFHNMPWGLQTHIYAPANVDLRNTYKICGNEPGEPPETHELGIGAPAEGLYLREDIEIKCNIAMTSFVKKETKTASKILMDRLVKKAELLDSGALLATREDGKLKTANPADRSLAKAASHRRPNSLPLDQQPYSLPPSPGRLPNSSPRWTNEQHRQPEMIMELPGDYYHAQPTPPYLQSSDYRHSTVSELSGQSPNVSSSG